MKSIKKLFVITTTLFLGVLPVFTDAETYIDGVNTLVGYAIDGSTIDDTVIGGTTPAAGTFTIITAPTIYGSSASGGDLTIEGSSHATNGDVLLQPTDGLVGIGTATPVNQLDIKKDAIGATPLDTNGLRLSNTTAAAAGAQQYSPGLVMQGQGWKTDATAASQKVEFLQDVRPVQGAAAPTGYWGLFPSINDAAYSTTPALSVTSAGNVGIGTSTPGAKLDLAGTGNTTDLFLSAYSPTDNFGSEVWLRKSNSNTIGTATATVTDSTLGILYFQGVDSGGNFDSGARIMVKQNGAVGDRVPSDMYLTTYSGAAENTNQLVLTTTNNVGIGTATPATKLDQAQFSADALSSYHTFSKSRHATAGSHTIVADNDIIGGIKAAPSDGTDFGTISSAIEFEVDDASPAASSIGGAIVFKTAAGAGADDLAERVRIDANGTTHLKGGQTVKKTNVADAAYGTSALTSDYIIAFTSLTASRTATISTEDVQSGTATQPRVIIVKDESGSAGTYNITISLENAGTIDGAASYVIDQPYQSATLYCNGSNCFVY